MNMQSTTDTRPNLTTTYVAALTSEQREGLETLINHYGRGIGWSVQVNERKISYFQHGKEVFSLGATVSTCERVVCHWNTTVGDNFDQRVMDAVVRCRKLSKAMKSKIDEAFDRAWVSGEIVKAGKTYLDVYAWAAALAVEHLCEYSQNWEEEEVEGMAESTLYRNGKYGFTDAQIAFVAESIRANRAASEARVLEALATLRVDATVPFHLTVEGEGQ